MELYEMELGQARKSIAAAGRDPADFTYEMEYLEPDPDGGGMFTVRYVVTITHAKTGKSLDAVGGIGMDWPGLFAQALEDGHFD